MWNILHLTVKQYLKCWLNIWLYSWKSIQEISTQIMNYLYSSTCLGRSQATGTRPLPPSETVLLRCGIENVSLWWHKVCDLNTCSYQIRMAWVTEKYTRTRGKKSYLISLFSSPKENYDEIVEEDPNGEEQTDRRLKDHNDLHVLDFGKHFPRVELLYQ